jgi:hypothetical protein
MFRWFVVAAAIAVLAACAPAIAAPVTVQVRVEGATSTIFEGPVTTDGKPIDKGSGPHPCDGTNLGANPIPGPTMTSALDDASLGGAFSWDGTWFSGFEDFGIDRVGPDAVDFANNRFWGYALNFISTQVGGCQQQVQAGDEVLFGYDFFSKAHPGSRSRTPSRTGRRVHPCAALSWQAGGRLRTGVRGSCSTRPA